MIKTAKPASSRLPNRPVLIQWWTLSTRELLPREKIELEKRQLITWQNRKAQLKLLNIWNNRWREKIWQNAGIAIEWVKLEQNAVQGIHILLVPCGEKWVKSLRFFHTVNSENLSNFITHKFRCHYARYCNRECQVADWKEHKKTCEPVVLAKANGHFLSELLESVDDPLDYIIARASHKNGSVKSITVNTAGELKILNFLYDEKFRRFACRSARSSQKTSTKSKCQNRIHGPSSNSEKCWKWTASSKRHKEKLYFIRRA